ncbi:hypothetical protein DFH08DRAFT_953739 [Mycena albidolilacea]|uniref:Myb-like domain-containing protein n=1 Tax=Mycena albidolilacea TaxID=1033008 RepID=A0AAD7AHD2_9AGAR|nr:hypothetical protein DFH08DRAFT_953739 [Mycena albidolilacea]
MARGKRRTKTVSSHTTTRRSTRLQDKTDQRPHNSPEVQDSSEREHSPPWIGVDGSQLPEDENHDGASVHSDHDESSEQPDAHPTPAEPSDGEDEPHTLSSQVMNARAPRWQSWQDRYLALAVDQTRPFLLPPFQREEGWNATAEVLRRDSTAEGPRSAVDRSGSACKNRFMKMMKEHKKGETQSRMKTGEVEEVSEHIKLMTNLQAIMDDHHGSAKENSAKSKRKADLEDKAGEELRDAAMRGLARAEGLLDISELDGASVREKQGQRKRMRRPLSPSKRYNGARSFGDDDSDVEPPPKRRRGRNQVVQDVLERHKANDTKRLSEARERAERQHAELLQAQTATLNAVTNLTTEIQGLRQDNRANANGTSRTTEILAEIVRKKF